MRIGKPKVNCSECAENAAYCTHSNRRQDCLICTPTDTGKTVNRGKTCLKHDKRRAACKECREAETDKEQRFFGKKERAALAAAKPR